MERGSVTRGKWSAAVVDAGLRATVLERARCRGEGARWLLATAAGLSLLLAACANRGMQVRAASVVRAASAVRAVGEVVAARPVRRAGAGEVAVVERAVRAVRPPAGVAPAENRMARPAPLRERRATAAPGAWVARPP